MSGGAHGSGCTRAPVSGNGLPTRGQLQVAELRRTRLCSLHTTNRAEMYSGLLYATPTLRRLLLQRLLLPRCEEAKRSELEAGARSRSTVIGSEVRGEHPLVREVNLDNPVHAEKKLREALGKVGKETSRRFPKALPDILWQILVMVFLRDLARSATERRGM